jgi:hypothetical protein
VSGYIVRDLPSIVITSSGSLLTGGVGSLDDADAITIFLSTATAALLLLPTVEISQFDPAIPTPVGVSQSTEWYASTQYAFTVGGAITISPVAFRGLRLRTSAGSSIVGGTVVAFCTKQIFV